MSTFHRYRMDADRNMKRRTKRLLALRAIRLSVLGAMKIAVQIGQLIRVTAVRAKNVFGRRVIGFCAHVTLIPETAVWPVRSRLLSVVLPPPQVRVMLLLLGVVSLWIDIRQT